ncbi:MAG: membrane protein insertion efficiency factor YidD [Chloroflexota bacterium]|nr:membrane protein insertion efficiency factor YidD [Chloroflexota bacterium]MDE2895417.1 membrane protein insertion efficiency factor YidD [Chloroflexota bacterium]
MSRAVAQTADRLVLLLLRGYQAVFSPMFAALGSQCRFEPSCSQYMIDAVQSRGALTGVVLGLWRLVRCNPFNRGGYDPAPSPPEGAPETSQDVSRETI